MSDMSGMDMGMGMDEADDGMFRPTAEHLSHVFWYLIAGAIGFGLIANTLRKADEILRYVVVHQGKHGTIRNRLAVNAPTVEIRIATLQYQRASYRKYTTQR